MCYRIFLMVLILSMPLVMSGQRRLPKVGNETLSGTVGLRVTETDQEPVETYTLNLDQFRKIDLLPDQEWSKFLHKRVLVRGTQYDQTFQAASVKLLDSADSLKAPQMTLPAGVSDWNIDPEKYNFGAPSFLTLPPPTHYTRSVYVVRIRFSDFDVPEKQPAELQQNFFGTTIQSPSSKGFFERQVGFFQIDGTVYPEVITIPFTKDYCAAQSRIYNECTEWVQNFLTNSVGVNLNGKSLCLVFPPAIDSAGGSATVGPKGDQTFTGNVWLPLRGNVLRFFLMISNHELGHNIGMPHSGAIGGDGILYQTDDRADFMAAKNVAGPNVFNRLMMGWFQGRLTTISGPTGPSGVFVRVQPFNSFTKQPRGLIIELRRETGQVEYRFIEWSRHQMPFNDLTLDMRYSNGLVIRKGDSNMVPYQNNSWVLDCNPQTPLPNDAPCLLGGQSWVEPEFGLTIDFYGTSIMGGLTIRVILTR